ncbi:uncharacterized protein LOC135492988 [Lineus longissimus]|uniref:uncharacterized protein LOC135492988 n=1 Tax=Lineus longissimus TaxID=88925 RepID=UPI00315C893B
MTLPAPALVTILSGIADHTIEYKIANAFWELETIGIKTDEDDLDPGQDFLKRCQGTSLKRNENGQYIASLPWKESHPELPSNYDVTCARKRAIVRKLDGNMRRTYNDIIVDQLHRQFIREVPDEDATCGHYLPHHSVKKDSPTTPIRIVYDASCRAARRPSLNDCLEPGPNLLNDLGRILLRFRLHPVGLSSDIQKAFLHDKLAEADRMFTKFLWLGDPDDPESRFRTLQFQVVPFGTVSSPFMLLAMIKTHRDSYDTPLAADIQENTYMDNIYASIQPTDAMTYNEKANEMMDDAGLKLRAWTSNDTTIRQRAQADNIDDPKPKVPAHGMIWDTEADTLT